MNISHLFKRMHFCVVINHWNDSRNACSKVHSNWNSACCITHKNHWSFMLKLTNWRILFCNRLWWFLTLWESPWEVSIYDHISGGVSGPCPYRSYQKRHFSVNDFDWKIKRQSILYNGLITSALHIVNRTCTANRRLSIRFPVWVTNFHWICTNTDTKAQNASPTVRNLRNLLQCCHCFLTTEH
jgi:hypothetical protein